MTDHTPSGLPQPQTAEFEDWAVSQMYAVRTDSGRLKWNSPAYEAIAKAALSAPAVETVAVQEAPDIIAACMKCATPELCAIRMECADRAYQSRVAPPLPVAPKAEPVGWQVRTTNIHGWSAWTESRGIHTGMTEAYETSCDGLRHQFRPVYATPQADSAQPVVADTLTDADLTRIAVSIPFDAFSDDVTETTGIEWRRKFAEEIARSLASPPRAEQAAPPLPPPDIAHAWTSLDEGVKPCAAYSVQKVREILAAHLHEAADRSAEAKDAARWRRLVNASEMPFPVATIADDPENDCNLIYGRTGLERLIDSYDEISDSYAAMGTPAAAEPGKGEGTRAGKLERSGYFAAGGDES